MKTLNPPDLTQGYKRGDIVLHRGVDAIVVNRFIESNTRMIVQGQKLVEVPASDLEYVVSPGSLLQERYRDDPWRMLICCILLNQTKRTQVDRIHDALFERFPNVQSIVNELAKDDQINLVASIAQIIRPTGFYNRKATSIVKMTIDLLKREMNESIRASPIRLPGIGRYGLESYMIFHERDTKWPCTDKEVVRWIDWYQHKWTRTWLIHAPMHIVHSVESIMNFKLSRNE